GTAASVSGLGSGTYKVVVTSIVGGVSCEGSQKTFTITQPTSVLSGTISSKDVTSVNPGNEGEVAVVASGGTAPYTYAWVNSTGTEIGTTAKVTGLEEGTYSVIVKDKNNCVTDSLSTEIAAPGCFTINTVSGDVALKCNGDTTDLEISLSDTSGNVSINWTTTDGDLTGITSNGLTLSGVGVGTYKATVIDNVLGCTKTATLNITEKAVLSGAIDVGQVGCRGLSTGTLDLSITGGTGSYTYIWTSTNVDLTNYTISNQDLINVPAGSYSVLVKDSNNCKLTVVETVVEPSDILSASVNPIDEKTVAGNDGSITVIPTGGTPNYTITIKLDGTTVDLWTGETTSNLAPGKYHISVIDANGCTYPTSAVIAKVPACTVDITITPSKLKIDCFGEKDITLTANITVPAGSSADTGSLVYAWTDGLGTDLGNANSISNVGVGTYKVVVSSTVGGQSCEGAQQIFEITEPTAALTANTGSKDVTSVNPGDEGEVWVTASGGTLDYSYEWKNSTGTSIGTTDKITGLTAGTYKVVVTDANGCVTSELTASVAAPGCFSIIGDSGDIALACNGDTTDISVALQDGSGNSTITWSSPDANLTGITLTNLSLTGVGVGTYNVSIKDNVLGCTKTATVNVTENAPLSGSVDVVQVQCKGDSSGSLDLIISGGTGTYTYSWTSINVDLASYPVTDQDLIGLPAGGYEVTVKDSNNCSIKIRITINEPQTNIEISKIETVVETCSVCEDGQIIVTSTGGTGAHKYSIDNGATIQTENTFTEVAPGTYTVTVYDANGCSLEEVDVIVPGDVAPDYKPVIYSGNTQIDKNGNVDFVVLIGELLGNNSDGITPVEFRIVKNPNVVYSFDTSVTSQGGIAVNNNDWEVDASHSFYLKFTYIGNGGIFMGDTASSIGLAAQLSSPNTEGLFPITTTIKFGCGGEVRVDNNVDRELMKFTK
ncbi:MAG: hypothetical protein COB98_07320, partial [Flavobacteriaceae bacterium]